MRRLQMNSDSVPAREFYYHNLKRKKEFHNNQNEDDLFYRRLSDELSALSTSSGVDVDADSSCGSSGVDGDAESGEDEHAPSPTTITSPVIKYI